MHTRAWAHVNAMVSCANHVFVVLHHNHAVANVAQMLERVDQAVVVALVQTNAGLIQHIHHTRQPRTDLRRQTNALRFTARERVRTAVQAQIVQAHIVEKLQTRGNFAHHFVCNFGLCTVQGEGFEIVVTFAQSGVADVINATRLLALAHTHMARFTAQTRAIASGASPRATVTRQIFAHHCRIGLAVAPLHVHQNAFEGVLLAEFFARIGA